MKYMTFNSSCSYAGVANMLESFQISVEDRQIALDMGLPYLFSYENGTYCSGPMLQTAEWFNLYLKPRGFFMSETRLMKGEVCTFLQKNIPAMLGLAVSPQGKHAFVCIEAGMKGKRYCFLNNKSQNSPEPESICFTEEELLPLLGDSVIVAVLQKSPPLAENLTPYLQKSADTLLMLKKDIKSFCCKEQTPQALRAAQNTLFRAILLDGITMLELLENEDLRKALQAIRRDFLTALKENKTLILADRISVDHFEDAIDTYRDMILAFMQNRLKFVF